MRLTTLCYAENDGRWLMMHRIKKDEDENAGKLIGPGGHLLEGKINGACELVVEHFDGPAPGRYQDSETGLNLYEL